MHPNEHDEHDDHDDHGTTVSTTGSINPHGKYMECHVAKGCRMYAAESDVTVLLKHFFEITPCGHILWSEHL